MLTRGSHSGCLEGLGSFLSPSAPLEPVCGGRGVRSRFSAGSTCHLHPARASSCTPSSRSARRQQSEAQQGPCPGEATNQASRPRGATWWSREGFPVHRVLDWWGLGGRLDEEEHVTAGKQRMCKGPGAGLSVFEEQQGGCRQGQVAPSPALRGFSVWSRGHVPVSPPRRGGRAFWGGVRISRSAWERSCSPY